MCHGPLEFIDCSLVYSSTSQHQVQSVSLWETSSGVNKSCLHVCLLILSAKLNNRACPPGSLMNHSRITHRCVEKWLCENQNYLWICGFGGLVSWKKKKKQDAQSDTYSGSHLSINYSTSTKVKNDKNEVYSDVSQQSQLTFDTLWCELACKDETLRTAVSVWWKCVV